MTDIDLTPRQAVVAYLGGEHVPSDVLRAAIAQYVVGYETLVDLAQDVVGEGSQHVWQAWHLLWRSLREERILAASSNTRREAQNVRAVLR